MSISIGLFESCAYQDILRTQGMDKETYCELYPYAVISGETHIASFKDYYQASACVQAIREADEKSRVA